jgi:hypothetical protein
MNSSCRWRCMSPPGVTYWTRRAMAKVASIWEARQLRPHRVHSFKRSRDPRLAEKMADVVGLPTHAVVLSIC